MTEAKVWKVFSQFIRLRDANENGECACFTCGLIRHWTKIDAGHGISRSKKEVIFSEVNVHAQCKGCNKYKHGAPIIYSKNVDKRYGAGTWDRLTIASKKYCKRTKNDFEILYLYYSEQVKRLKESKGL